MATYSSNSTIAATATRYSLNVSGTSAQYTVPAGRWAQVIFQSITNNGFTISNGAGTIYNTFTSTAGSGVNYMGPGDVLAGSSGGTNTGIILVIEYRTTP